MTVTHFAELKKSMTANKPTTDSDNVRLLLMREHTPSEIAPMQQVSTDPASRAFFCFPVTKGYDTA